MDELGRHRHARSCVKTRGLIQIYSDGFLLAALREGAEITSGGEVTKARGEVSIGERILLMRQLAWKSPASSDFWCSCRSEGKEKGRVGRGVKLGGVAAHARWRTDFLSDFCSY